jgi:hypothetical protein
VRIAARDRGDPCARGAPDSVEPIKYSIAFLP